MQKTLLLLLSFITLIANAVAQRLVIEGRYAGGDDATVYLKAYTDRKFVLVDSARTVRGRFFFNRAARDVVAYGVTSSRGAKQPPLFFAGADTVRLRLDEREGSLRVEGSPTDSLYRLLLPLTQQEGFRIDSLAQRLKASPLVPYFVMKSFAWRLSLEELQGIKASLDTVLRYNVYYQQMERLIAAREGLREGCVAPNFSLRATDGRRMELRAFRGRPVVLNFWASWCGDCRREMPLLAQAYPRLQEQGVAVVGVSMDTSARDWLAAIEKMGLRWTQLSDLRGWDSSVAPLYALRWIPTTYILDAEGRIVSVSYNSRELDGHLRQAFPAAFE